MKHIALALALCLLLSGCGVFQRGANDNPNNPIGGETSDSGTPGADLPFLSDDRFDAEDPLVVGDDGSLSTNWQDALNDFTDTQDSGGSVAEDAFGDDFSGFQIGEEQTDYGGGSSVDEGTGGIEGETVPEVEPGDIGSTDAADSGNQIRGNTGVGPEVTDWGD
jgi:hypothetical protein